MWFVKAILFILLLTALLYVALLNDDQPVNLYLKNPNVPTVPNVDLPVVLVGSLVTGMLLGFFISLFQVISSRSEVAGLKRRNRELTRELTDLRNMPVKDLDLETLPPLPSDEETPGG